MLRTIMLPRRDRASSERDILSNLTSTSSFGFEGRFERRIDRALRMVSSSELA
jgi:hypothetical protein